MIKLKKLLLETPEANPDDIFGEYLFGSKRLDEPASKEKDTAKEKKLIDGLFWHFRDKPYNNILALYSDIILDLIKSGKYLNLLKPDEKNKYAYRLLFDLSIKKANEILDLNIKEEDIEIGMYDYPLVLNKKIIYKPIAHQNKLSSWTIEPKIKSFNSVINFKQDLREFYYYHDPRVYAIVRSKIKNNNFFINFENLLNNTADIIKFKNEKEVISYGDVEIDKICFCVLFHDKNKRELDDNWCGKSFNSFDATKYSISKVIKYLTEGII
jgi:hypothetical protein